MSPGCSPHAAGNLVRSEAEVFRKVLTDPDRPYVVILGGAKVSDKLGVIGNLLDSVDRLLIGGGMCYTFLAAQGQDVGDSLLEADQIDTVKQVLSDAAERGVEVVLPVDVVVADDFAPDANTRVVPADGISAGWRGLDIGPASVDLFRSRLADARTIVWNGPMGVFEMPAVRERHPGDRRGRGRIVGLHRDRRRRQRGRNPTVRTARRRVLAHLHRRWCES